MLWLVFKLVFSSLNAVMVLTGVVVLYHSLLFALSFVIQETTAEVLAVTEIVSPEITGAAVSTGVGVVCPSQAPKLSPCIWWACQAGTPMTRVCLAAGLPGG